MESNEWQEFLPMACQAMLRALNNEITLNEASLFFENARAIKNAELRQYIVRYIWEIDGFRNVYMDLMNLFERGASQDVILSYFMDSD